MFAYPLVDEGNPQNTPEERVEYEKHKAHIYHLIETGAPERERDQAILALVKWLGRHKHWKWPPPYRQSPRQRMLALW